MAPSTFYYEKSADPALHRAISQKVWDFYIGNGKIGKETYREYGRIFGDRFFATGIRRAVVEHAKKPDFPIYPYIFNYTGSHSITQGLFYTKESYGVAHAEELQYLFNKTFGAPEYITGKDAEFSKNLIKLFVSFARDGVPSATFGTTTKWEPYVNQESDDSETHVPWYVIDEDTKVVTEDPFKVRTDFWEGLPLSELKNEDKIFLPEKEEL